MIASVSIRNFRRFRKLDLDLDHGINIVVGQNDAGKSTLMEAINLALTGRFDGRPLIQTLTPYLINSEANREYCKALQTNKNAPLPELLVEVRFSDDPQLAQLQGTNNLSGVDAPGIAVKASFNPEFEAEYKAFIAQAGDIDLAPTEYYRVEWLSFAGSAISRRSVPASAALIESSGQGWKPGADHHLQRALDGTLDAKERAELAREYRSVREAFKQKEPVKKINEKLGKDASPLTEKSLRLGIDISQRHTWESGLTLHLDDLPMSSLGTGERNALKTLMAIGRSASEAKIVLLEEPETNLSASNLRRLLSRILAGCKDRQVIITTHSSFVLNKLGLKQMILLEGDKHGKLSKLGTDTVDYFRRLPGFDTLRLVLADRAILVEGPSDELVVQRAYRDRTTKDPLDDGVEVISVGTAHKRFLELGTLVGREIRVVRDRDKKTVQEVEQMFSPFKGPNISIHTGTHPHATTLEPEITAVNDAKLLGEILGRTFGTAEEATQYMTDNKTAAALAIYESAKSITMPEYIRNAVTWT